MSVPEKADLRELCSTFTPLLIHPSLLLCLPGWTEESEKAEGEVGKGGQTDGSDSRQTENAHVARKPEMQSALGGTFHPH